MCIRDRFWIRAVVPRTGLEPARRETHAPETCASTNSATWACRENSSYWLYPEYRAANETRTRDPDLGKVVLYQLSYCRISIPDFTGRISLNAVAKVMLFSDFANFSYVFFQKRLLQVSIHAVSIILIAELAQRFQFSIAMKQGDGRMRYTIEHRGFYGRIVQHILEDHVLSDLQFMIKLP